VCTVVEAVAACMTPVNHVLWSPKKRASQMLLRRMLVGLDFRQPSLAAAKWAAAHFGTHAEIELAHVRSVPEVPTFVQQVLPLLDDRLETATANPLPALRGLAATLSAQRLSLHARAGPPVSTLADLARTTEADLVVLGRKTLDGSRGRTLERLIRCLSIPALVIGGHGDEQPRRILAAVDDASVGDEVVDWAASLAKYFGAELTLLHVLSDALLAHDWNGAQGARENEGVARLGSNFSWVAAAHAWLRGFSCTNKKLPVVRTVVAVGAPRPVILERARAIRADLIVVGRNGAHATGHTDIGSATRLILRGSRLPTLVVPTTSHHELLHGQSVVGVEPAYHQDAAGTNAE
jgi:nucleotide-binding universal stress UspA family protein